MKKRLAGIVVLAGALALLLSGSAFALSESELEEYARNGFEVAAPRSSEDTGWSFYMNFHGTDAVFPREKEDWTSVYIYVQYKNMDRYNVYVDGVDDTNGSGRLACTDDGEAYVMRTGEFQIYNQVWEEGKKYAQLTGWATYEGGSTGGLWSPDSVGYYPTINKNHYTA